MEHGDLAQTFELAHNRKALEDRLAALVLVINDTELKKVKNLARWTDTYSALVSEVIKYTHLVWQQLPPEEVHSFMSNEVYFSITGSAKALRDKVNGNPKSGLNKGSRRLLKRAVSSYVNYLHPRNVPLNKVLEVYVWDDKIVDFPAFVPCVPGNSLASAITDFNHDADDGHDDEEYLAPVTSLYLTRKAGGRVDVDPGGPVQAGRKNGETLLPTSQVPLLESGLEDLTSQVFGQMDEEPVALPEPKIIDIAPYLERKRARKRQAEGNP